VTTTDLVDRLAQHKTLGAAPRKELEWLASHGAIRRVNEGDLMLAQGETENYASTVALPQSENCTITHYHSTQDTSVSWQAKMLVTDDFGKADHAYRELYQKLQQCYIQLSDGTIIYLKGNWSPAKEEAPFTSSTLRLTIDDQRYKGVRVELELVYELAQWGVSINIFSRETDDKAQTVLREP